MHSSRRDNSYPHEIGGRSADSSKLLASDDFLYWPGDPRRGPLLPGLGQEPAGRFVNGWLQVVWQQTLPLDTGGALRELLANGCKPLRLHHQIDRCRRQIARRSEQPRVCDVANGAPRGRPVVEWNTGRPDRSEEPDARCVPTDVADVRRRAAEECRVRRLQRDDGSAEADVGRPSSRCRLFANSTSSALTVGGPMVCMLSKTSSAPALLPIVFQIAVFIL